jgi:hypothetical protein
MYNDKDKMKKLYDLWVMYCPLPKLLGLDKKAGQPIAVKTVVKKTKKTTKKSVEQLAPYKLKRINKTKLTDLASGYGLVIDEKMTKNQIIDTILEFYNGEK